MNYSKSLSQTHNLISFPFIHFCDEYKPHYTWITFEFKAKYCGFSNDDRKDEKKCTWHLLFYVIRCVLQMRLYSFWKKSGRYLQALFQVNAIFILEHFELTRIYTQLSSTCCTHEIMFYMLNKGVFLCIFYKMRFICKMKRCPI